jgi:hypothetical protein
MRGARFELAKLRTEGVAIRNEGRSISHKQVLSKWEKKVGDWNSAVISSMGEINQADAEWFSVMDVIPDARLPIENTIPNDLTASAVHHKLYREHDFQLRRLGEMLYEIWER